jgi:predicted phage terminase large subunit-like protein
MSTTWYRSLFCGTRLSSDRQAIQEFTTTQSGFRLSTSIGGVLTGRGADFIVIDDPLKPDEALSETQRNSANNWFDHTLISRLNDKTTGCIVLVMQRLHEDDLVGHVLRSDNWKVLRFPAIAEEDEIHEFQTPYGMKRYERKLGEALHPDREPLEVLKQIREIQGEYTFSGQYQQAPAPLDGGLFKASWLKSYKTSELPERFELIFQSWDTANKPKELSDYSVCTTWGVKEKHLFLLSLYRKRVAYPDLKRAVREQCELFRPQTILIEDKASGTQLIQELVNEGIHQIQKYEPTMDKTMRMQCVTSTIENGFVHVPESAPWLAEYVHELVIFDKGRYDDQVDSTSQGLDWFRNASMDQVYGLLEYAKGLEKRAESDEASVTIPASIPCTGCSGNMTQRIANGLRCQQCGAQWSPPRQPQRQLSRADILNRTPFTRKRRWGR